MITTYRLHVNELTVDLIKSIKSAFKGKTVEITVSDVLDETEYLLANDANRISLERSMKQAEKGEVVTLTVQELQEKYGTK